MNREQFKSLLQRDKIFLKELYESDSQAKSKRILNFASDAELNTLTKYFHFVSNGEIKIKKQNFDALAKRHLNLIKKHFEKKSNAQNLIQTSRKTKISLIFKLLPVLNHLLAPLFNQ